MTQKIGTELGDTEIVVTEIAAPKSRGCEHWRVMICQFWPKMPHFEL